jgi:hypothetical protein
MKNTPDTKLNLINKHRMLAEGFCQIPNPIMSMTEITSAAKTVWGVLSNRAREGGHGRICPTQRTIARDTGLSVSTVKRAIQELINVRPAEEGTKKSPGRRTQQRQDHDNPHKMLEVMHHYDAAGNYTSSDYLIYAPDWIFNKYSSKEGIVNLTIPTCGRPEKSGAGTPTPHDKVSPPPVQNDLGVAHSELGVAQNDLGGQVKVSYKEEEVVRIGKKNKKEYPPAGDKHTPKRTANAKPAVASDPLTDLTAFNAITRLPGDHQQHLNAFAAVARSMCAKHNVSDDSVIASIMSSCLSDLASWQSHGRDKPRDLSACFKSTLAKNFEAYLSRVPPALMPEAPSTVDEKEFEWP